MSSDNIFDSDETIFPGPMSEDEESTIFFFLDHDPENKLSIKSGDTITVGRSLENIFFIENKTISRNHLTIRRTGSDFEIEIHGRNGLYMDNQLYMEQTLKFNPPVSFVIGDVECSIEPEIDEDKTIIVQPGQMAGFQKAAQENAVNIAAPPKETALGFETKKSEPEDKNTIQKPFDTSPIDTFISSGREGSSIPRPSDVFTSESNMTDPKGFEPPQPVQNSSRSGYTQFEPVAAGKKIKSRQGPNPITSLLNNKSNLLIAGIIVLSILIIVLIFIFLFTNGDKETKAQTPVQVEETNQTDKIETTTASPDSHKILIDLAEDLIKSGDIITAKDVLLDIPKTSPYYDRAKKLMRELPEN